jgi:hypothetical protein
MLPPLRRIARSRTAALAMAFAATLAATPLLASPQSSGRAL